MPADDLNERVQAEIEVYERLAQINTSKSRMSSEFLVRMVASWRERWERHRPRDESKPFDGITPRCWTCRSATGLPKYIEPDLCPDALSVLREIGIEP